MHGAISVSFVQLCSLEARLPNHESRKEGDSFVCRGEIMAVLNTGSGLLRSGKSTGKKKLSFKVREICIEPGGK